ncbi:hypothetical protein NT05LI_0178 [Listeria ivanovii FSL F6-596]|nr:hypothetical protein NT05LI_0178 [Listeria ivanovii FSL F6-596]
MNGAVSPIVSPATSKKYVVFLKNLFTFTLSLFSPVAICKR